MGGRLAKAEWAYSQRFPIILPSASKFTNLVIADIHAASHSRAERTLADLRRHYWVIHGRTAVKSVLSKCMKCRRLYSQPAVPYMAALPYTRLAKECRPFTNTGVDCFGPFSVTAGRGRAKAKRYVCLYTCMSTRGVSLEVLHSMDAESFLLSFSRFVSCRGVPATMCSDRGINFVAGAQDLAWYGIFSHRLVTRELERKGIN